MESALSAAKGFDSCQNSLLKANEFFVEIATKLRVYLRQSF